MPTSRRTTLLGLLAAGLLFVAACGGSSSPKPAASSSSPSAPPSTSSSTSSSSSSSSSASSSSAAAGTVEAFAGTGQYAVDGDVPGPALAAGMDRPEGVAVTKNGDVYIADNDSQRILLVHSGTISVVYTGSTAAGESNTYGVAVAPDDSVWFSNGSGVFKLAGTQATKVLSNNDQLLSGPFALTFDKNGNLYIVEVGGQRVKKYDTTGAITVIAGTGEQSAQAGGVGDGGPGNAAPLGTPQAVAVDTAGNVYVSESFTRRVRKITPDGTITTFAGGGTTEIAKAKDGVAGRDILFDTVDRVAVDAAGKVYVTDHAEALIVRFGPDGKLEHVAGSSTGTKGDGKAPLATILDGPLAMTFDRNGDLYFVDSLRVRRIKGVG